MCVTNTSTPLNLKLNRYRFIRNQILSLKCKFNIHPVKRLLLMNIGVTWCIIFLCKLTHGFVPNPTIAHAMTILDDGTNDLGPVNDFLIRKFSKTLVKRCIRLWNVADENLAELPNETNYYFDGERDEMFSSKIADGIVDDDLTRNWADEEVSDSIDDLDEKVDFYYDPVREKMIERRLTEKQKAKIRKQRASMEAYKRKKELESIRKQRIIEERKRKRDERLKQKMEAREMVQMRKEERREKRVKLLYEKAQRRAELYMRTQSTEVTNENKCKNMQPIILKMCFQEMVELDEMRVNSLRKSKEFTSKLEEVAVTSNERNSKGAIL